MFFYGLQRLFITIIIITTRLQPLPSRSVLIWLVQPLANCSHWSRLQHRVANTRSPRSITTTMRRPLRSWPFRSTSDTPNRRNNPKSVLDRPARSRRRRVARKRRNPRNRRSLRAVRLCNRIWRLTRSPHCQWSRTRRATRKRNERSADPATRVRKPA